MKCMKKQETFELHIVSAEGQIYHGFARQLMALTVTGYVGILAGHMPFLTRLQPGPIEMLDGAGEKRAFYISGGLLEVQPRVSTVLADTVIRAETMDKAAMLEAKKRAQAILSEKEKNLDYAKAQAHLIEILSELNQIQKLKGRMH